MTNISKALGRIQPSATLAMTAKVTELKAQGIDVIGLSAGEPDFDTPDFVKDAAIQAIRDGDTNYTTVDGTAALKQAIVGKFARDNGLTYTTKQITANSGGKHTLFNALVATLDVGDEVIIPAPYWVSYPDIVNFAGGTPVFIEAGADQGYKITPEQLEAAITPKTKWVLLNSPSNPSGAAYSADELKALGAVILPHEQVMVMTDDMYEHIWYADFPFATIAQVCPELFDRTLTVNGVSKAYAMTGWRIGYLATPSGEGEFAAHAGKLHSQMLSSIPAFCMPTIKEALEHGAAEVERMRLSFAKRGAMMFERLNAIEGVRCVKPLGAFYCFPELSGCFGRTTPQGVVINDAIDFCTALLEEASVAVVPGTDFGPTAAACCRLSFAASEEEIEKGCQRLASFVSSLS